MTPALTAPPATDILSFVPKGTWRMDQVASPACALERWEQQQAETNLAEVIRRAHTDGPQLVAGRNTEAVVVIAVQDYDALVAHRPLRFSDLLLPGEGFEPARADTPAEYRPVSI
jgi:prevent-host-death family protein